LALGYYAPNDSDEFVPVAFANALLFADNGQAPVSGGTVLVDGQQLTLWLGIENRLSKQFIRVTRVDCSYDVQGSNLSIPSDATPKGFVLGATDTTDDGFADDTAVRPQVGFLGLPLVSTDVFSYLNVNRNSLPPLPFRMTATCSATGISQAGDVFTTNPVSITIVFFEEAECCTGDSGFQNGTGTGGTLPGSEEADSLSLSGFGAVDNGDGTFTPVSGL
jgi:hypothetical protein